MLLPPVEVADISKDLCQAATFWTPIHKRGYWCHVKSSQFPLPSKRTVFGLFLACIITQENWRSSRSRKLELLSENPLKSISIKSCHAIETNDPIVDLARKCTITVHKKQVRCRLGNQFSDFNQNAPILLNILHLTLMFANKLLKGWPVIFLC